jgi:hypothetical protein
MLRNIPKPFYTGRFGPYLWVKALGHSMVDDRCFFFFIERNQLFFVGDKLVNLGGFAVEIGGDGGLFGEGRKTKRKFYKYILI